jgi:hypothetical protein
MVAKMALWKEHRNNDEHAKKQVLFLQKKG